MDKVISRTISEIDKVKNENLELNDKLNRARAEIEELKKTVLQKCPNCNEEYLSPIGAKLYAENEQIKKDYAKLHIDFAKCNGENEQLKEESKELKSGLVSQASIIFTLEKSSNDLSLGINKLYKVLQEIRDIVREETETRMLFADEKSFCDFCKIQDKINEVIGVK